MKELTCLSEDLIQQWIDGELSEKKQKQVNKHLAGCEKCRQKAEQQKALAFSIKKILTTNDVVIREFRMNETASREHGNEQSLNNKSSIAESKAFKATPIIRLKKTLPIWLKIAAVLLPAFCLVQVLFQSEKSYQPSHDELIMYESLSDMDANAAFQQRVMVTTSTNQEGEIVEFEIN
jgi:hypothetical protein